jgi:ribulose-5-phosphate 4-epimerase/fuculose-1-phosphate aldolase
LQKPTPHDRRPFVYTRILHHLDGRDLGRHVGTVQRPPYVRPGDLAAGDQVRALGGRYAAVLLTNHGPVVSGRDLFSAVCASEKLEETAKLLVTLGDRKVLLLDAAAVADLKPVFGTI